MPAAASIPDCRIPPPKVFLHLRDREIVSASPTRTEPTGAPSPFDRQTEMVSKSLTMRAGSVPLPIAALKSLAPSRWALQSFS